MSKRRFPTTSAALRIYATRSRHGRSRQTDS